jgi:hypothetical protein
MNTQPRVTPWLVPAPFSSPSDPSSPGHFHWFRLRSRRHPDARPRPRPSARPNPKRPWFISARAPGSAIQSAYLPSPSNCALSADSQQVGRLAHLREVQTMPERANGRLGWPNHGDVGSTRASGLRRRMVVLPIRRTAQSPAGRPMGRSGNGVIYFFARGKRRRNPGPGHMKLR